MARTVRSYKEWHKSYELFVTYKQEFPDVPIPARAKYHDFNLGRWVRTQRITYKKGTLSAERIKLLDEVRFVWEIYKPATEVIAKFERGEDVSTPVGKGFPDCIRIHLWQKYNNSCAIGLVNLNNFTILPESFLILDGKICGFKGEKPNGNPNLDIAHLDDIYSNNTITNLLPLCPNCHGSITYGTKQTLEHLKKVNVTSRRRRGSKTRQSIPSD